MDDTTESEYIYPSVGTQDRCSIKTFWLGFSDWLLEKNEAPLPAVLTQTLEDTALFAKPTIAVTLIVLSLFLIGVLLRLADQHQVFRGVRTDMAAQAATALTCTIIPVMLLALTLRSVSKLRCFCKQMCERGRRIQAARGGQ